MVNAFIQERELFPPAMPFRSGFLQRDKQEIYYEQCGNLDGQPLLFLHGGPGAEIAPAHRRLFDPKRFHVVLFDQNLMTCVSVKKVKINSVNLQGVEIKC